MHYNIRLNGTEFVTLTDPTPIETDIDAVEWHKTVSRKEVPVKWGDIIRHRAYRLYLNVADEILFDAFCATLDEYSETFILDDHNADLMTVRFLTPPKKGRYKSGNKFADIEMLEVEGLVTTTTT